MAEEDTQWSGTEDFAGFHKRHLTQGENLPPDDARHGEPGDRPQTGEEEKETDEVG